MDLSKKTIGLLISLFIWSIVTLGQARVSEELIEIPTYPFSDPNPVTTLVSKPEIYPYHKFEGYSHTSEPKQWKVVTLENDYIKVFILPEVGGKVWGAIEKSTGKDYIYKNEVMKFRNIAMRGPWTSGGIEFNFGIIGHTPSTATPVDYQMSENADGSVSCTVGTIDLPSRTQWRVTIELQLDKAYFTTKTTWYNPTALTHPYYNWMTAAAKATNDLTFYIPGEQALHHSGELRNWPVEKNGKEIWKYKENDFGPNKSYHVVGRYHNFFGGYWKEEGIGFAHLGRQETMPGQKLWLWSLARDGGIWEDLLTDTNGQYAEYQAGRLLNQYFNESYNNPITEAAFAPHLTDNWEEHWVPVKGTEGITAIDQGVVLNIVRERKKTLLKINALKPIEDKLQVLVSGEMIYDKSLKMRPMEVIEIALEKEGSTEVRLGGKVVYDQGLQQAKELKRPFKNQTDIVLRPAALSYAQATELSKRRRYLEAKTKLKECIAAEPDYLQAHNLMAQLYYRDGHYDSALIHANVVLQFDTYDDDANYTAGLAYKANNDKFNALDALGFAGRSMKYRSAAFTEIAQLELSENQLADAIRDANYALSFNDQNVAALQVLLISHRLNGQQEEFDLISRRLLTIDPLNHFARFENYLFDKSSESLELFKKDIFNEFPHQTHLEIASIYLNAGLSANAAEVLEESPNHPLVSLWLAYCLSQMEEPYSTHLDKAVGASAEFVFPYRMESLQVLQWAMNETDSWKVKYYLGLNLWGKSRLQEAADLLRKCENEPRIASFYVARSSLLNTAEGADPQQDLEQALALGNSDWRYHHALVKYFQEQKKEEQQLAYAEVATELFPDNYVISLDYAKSLLDNGSCNACLEVLDEVQVLPAEGAFSGRKIYGDASIRAALQYYQEDRYDKAQEKLELSHLYPENLGSGKPFEPDERLIDFFMGQITYKLGKSAKQYYQDVIANNSEEIDKHMIFKLLAYRSLGNRKGVAELLEQLKSQNENENAKWILDKWESQQDPIELIKELTD